MAILYFKTLSFRMHIYNITNINYLTLTELFFQLFASKIINIWERILAQQEYDHYKHDRNAKSEMW